MIIKIWSKLLSYFFPHLWFIFVFRIMNTEYFIPEPLLFNPIKHHLGFIREFVNLKIDQTHSDIKDSASELKHIGTSVMDVYNGSLSVSSICTEMENFLIKNDLLHKTGYSVWVGTKVNCQRIISFSDDSRWTLKFHDNNMRFVHIFPARNSRHTFRVKANTLKSALLYNILIGKDLVTADDLNKVRPLLGLSPVKDTIDSEAILEMIEILRASGTAFRVRINPPGTGSSL
jgi:hypothetical protein